MRQACSRERRRASAPLAAASTRKPCTSKLRPTAYLSASESSAKRMVGWFSIRIRRAADSRVWGKKGFDKNSHDPDGKLSISRCGWSGQKRSGVPETNIVLNDELPLSS